MKPKVLLIEEYISPPLLKAELNTNGIENKLAEYIKSIQKAKKETIENDQEHEEHFKNHLNQFFLDVYDYKNNTHQRIDSVIRENGNIRTIIEVKRPKNTKEMIQPDDFNRKAFHEALLYYYEQRQSNAVTVNHILITDCKKFYLISSEYFEKLIQNKSVSQLLEGFKAKANNIIRTTEALYEALAPVLSQIKEEIPAVFVDIQAPDLNAEHLYKLFCEYTLFNKPIANDANALNRRFYNELLYIMGLKEDKNFALVPNGVKNTLLDLTQEVVKNKTPKADIFETSLSLNILWLNRILFLKLLESQLKTVRNDKNLSLLNPEDAADPNALYNLFFNVLNKPRHRRSLEDQETYQYIPYLNSSLFVPASIEDKYDISSINGKRKIKVQGGSILGAKYAHKEMPLLEYLLSFLNCYQFNREDEGSDPNTVIKSSVLGLVFEQLNGYKDGSHFTPAVITMYICEQAIQRQAIKHFNEAFSTDCSDMDELAKYAASNFHKKDAYAKAQGLIDSITIIDPAVGSGHFLVSALNELIHIKSRLGLLHDGISVSVQNDELLISYTNGSPFIYQIQDGAVTKVQEEIQTLIFNTKKHIIENQLFGVDINPNSVNICRLRLWIELLKHSYFTDSRHLDMEALPNLEFKVITANSLIPIPEMHLYFDNKKQGELRLEMNRYYNATLDEKEIVKTEVKALIAKVKEDSRLTVIENYDPFDTQVSSPFFDSGLMFGVEHFDICIGNPPYVYNRDIDKAMLAQYKAVYGYNNDLYTYFYLRAFEFIHPKGIMAYITSNTFLTLTSKTKLRVFLQSKRLLKIRLVENIFEKAAVEPVIVMAEHSQEESYRFIYADDRKQPAQAPENATEVSIDTFKNAPNGVFFTPSPYNLSLAAKYFPLITPILTTYWGVIETSANIEKHKGLLEAYKASLKAGDVTLLGMITEGGQGLATANNGYFIGVREGTRDAQRTHVNRLKKMAEFNKEQGTDYDISAMAEPEIRELFSRLKAEKGRDVFGQGFLYQIISPEEFADVPSLSQDEKENGIAPERGKTFVPYDKGDREGNRWYMPTVYGINWSKENVKFLKSNSGKTGQGMPVVRNPQFYFREGFCWNDINGDKNTNNIKMKISSNGVYDVSSMKLHSAFLEISVKYICCIMNSNFMNRYTEAFINFTIHFQMNDMRQVPIVIPTAQQLAQAEGLFDRAKAVKDRQITGELSESQADEFLEPIQAEVDAFVEGLYGLDEDEIRVVEG